MFSQSEQFALFATYYIYVCCKDTIYLGNTNLLGDLFFKIKLYV